ncbi:MAG: sulfatase-like hydrolase/transferase [Pseudomonadota bacterium]
MTGIKNYLFVMCDHLRWDHLSCYGHPLIRTPNIDWLAQNGVRFSHAFAQSPNSSASRASFYTGRTSFSHGVTGNQVPLPLSEWTLGDYVRGKMRAALIGRTDLSIDDESLERIGVERNQTTMGEALVHHQNNGGFEVYEPMGAPNGLLSDDAPMSGAGGYAAWLRSIGYASNDPWREFAQVTMGPDGEPRDGNELANSRFPGRLKEGHSETAFLTDRALDFIRETEDEPWFLHLAYSKPDAPFIAPAPFHALYADEPMIAAKRDPIERSNAHPVFAALSEMDAAKPLMRDEVRAAVLPAYLGLVRQIDYHLGRILIFLRERNLLTQTMVVFTSNHGVNLGDHWLSGNRSFHDQSIRIPLIILDPSEAGRAGRRRVEDRPVESIDVLPTFLDAMGIRAPQNRLEGHSLLGMVHGSGNGNGNGHTDRAVLSEFDYAQLPMGNELGIDGDGDARAFMLRTPRWKYIHFLGYRPQLYDLENDPDEYRDLGAETGYEDIRRELHQALFDRLLRRRHGVSAVTHH